ncbi:TetR/AcrR family transcriptional regulator [Skermania sp. ID1734]|uniref:TetR/AcrR family transcriptional regulator n=1 Tax=Skermania sp. ID1734 TaxID=2597516 RepID=UPI00117FE317|nr:TetR/AcrR family transcriptional regulator [Skermania sp. ID1734]TSE01514.1 TetR/AcrR family transcriptional regulator [Skermania sp. ID1734]
MPAQQEARRGRKSEKTRSAPAASNPRRDLVEKQIMEHATRLFAERGFAATSLQDIADATGLTRPALYHYVANKDELLARLVSEITEEPAALLHGINERGDLGPVDKLRAMASAIALHQTQSPERFQVMIRSEAELPEGLSKSYQQSRRRVLKEFVTVIDDGIASGEFRPLDSRTAALGIIGMLNWVAWWYRPGGGASKDQAVANQLADMAIHSLVIEGQAAQSLDGPARAIAQLRQNLDYLERHLDAQP